MECDYTQDNKDANRKINKHFFLLFLESVFQFDWFYNWVFKDIWNSFYYTPKKTTTKFHIYYVIVSVESLNRGKS